MADREPGDDREENTPTNRYGVRTVRDMLGGVFERVSTRKPSRGVPCGIGVVDAVIGGFRPGRVTVLGAATSWGKSSFAVQTIDVGLRVGARILLVTGEDPEDMYAQRIMTRRSGVNAMRLRDGAVDGRDLSRMATVAEEAEDARLFLDGRGRSVEWLAVAIREIVAETTADLVIVDYIQAFACAKRTQDRRNEVTHIARTFIDAIKLSGASGLVFSQLKRLEDNARPTKHDLKESGDVENMAEHVLIGYEVAPRQRDGAPPPAKKKYILVEKNKDGPVVPDPIEMPFDPVTANFMEQPLERRPAPTWQNDRDYDA